MCDSQVPNKFIDRILWCDCVQGMKALPDNCIPMTLTSPPYDALYLYGGHSFNFKAVAAELFRITEPGGLVVWIVQEQIVDGSETGSSSRQRLFFQELGFNLHHTMVMHGSGTRHHHKVRYGGPLQFAFILSKGEPRHINLIRDRPNKHGGRTKSFMQRFPNGELLKQHKWTTRTWGVRGPIWHYATGLHIAQERYTNLHPARMAEPIARDHILSWSRPGDLIFDPMCGVGTTAKMAYLNNRHYLGMEIHGPYWVKALRRLRDVRQRQKALS